MIGPSARRAVLAAALALSGTASSAAPATDDVAVLTELDRAMQQAVVDRDPVAFGAFLTDDYILVVSNSRLVRKPEVVADIDSPDGRMDVNASTIVDVRVHGDTALVIADLHQVGRHGDAPFDYRVRYTDTWVRTAAGWKCISGHATRLPE
jgi:ketosteroid isomerase-like protein